MVFLLLAMPLSLLSGSQHVLLRVAKAFVVVLFASVYPAWRAAKYDPVEVIRGAH